MILFWLRVQSTHIRGLLIHSLPVPFNTVLFASLSTAFRKLLGWLKWQEWVPAVCSPCPQGCDWRSKKQCGW